MVVYQLLFKSQVNDEHENLYVVQIRHIISVTRFYKYNIIYYYT